MTILKLRFFYLMLMIYSCSPRNPDTLQDKKHPTTDTPSDAEDWQSTMTFVSDSSEMQILSFTDTLYRGDTLRIRFKVPHFTDFAIVDPDGEFFFIVYTGLDSSKPPLKSPEVFKQLEQLEIITDKTKANRWNVEAKINELIFTQTGVYELRLSENLETDDGTPVEFKTVYYINESRSRYF